MTCIKCKSSLPDDALFCHRCGKKQAVTKRKRRKRAKGTGTITYIDGLSSPYRASLPEVESPGGKRTTPVLGYYKTYDEAELALNTAIATQRVDKVTLTLGDLWERFKASEYFDQLSKGGQISQESAWTHLSIARKVKVREFTTDTFQNIVRGMTYEKKVRTTLDDGTEQVETVDVPHKRASKAKVRNLASLLCKEAMGLGVITVNYGALVKLPRDDTKETASYPTTALKLLFKNKKDSEARIILSWCFTGMRPSELFLLNVEDAHFGPPDYCIGGIKTAAGKNRIIPIPPVIAPFFREAAGDRTTGPLFLSAEGSRIDRDNWRRRNFKPYLAKLGLGSAYTLNSGRHTYFTMNRRRGTNEEIMMQIMGHEDYATGVENYGHWTEEDIKQIYDAVKDMKI